MNKRMCLTLLLFISLFLVENVFASDEGTSEGTAEVVGVSLPSPFPKLAYFDLSIINIPAYVVQFPFVESVTVTICIVNKNLEAHDVTFRCWLTDAKTGETVFSMTQTIFISGSDKKEVFLKVPVLKEGDYTFHVTIEEPTNIVVSGGTTQTFKVYSIGAWLLGPGLFILIIILAVVAFAIVAWLKHEEYL